MKYQFIFLLGLLFLTTMISAGTQDISFKIKIDYIPNFNDTCFTDSTNNSLNQTTHWTNCSTISNGQIRISKGEAETTIGLVIDLSDIRPGDIHTGYKMVDLGNLSDITGINDKLEYFANCNDLLNDCMDSNRNISSHLTLLEEDSGLKSNFTECSTNLIKANSELEIKKSDIKTKKLEIESLKSSKLMWILLGGIISAVLIYVVVPKMRGKDTPTSSTGNDLPPNPGY